jgi:RNA polymerase sigma-70 factor (ECF subfamily)
VGQTHEAETNDYLAPAPATDAVRETDRASVDVQTFEQLTMPHLTAVARFARSLTRDRARADDLVQETYLQALRGWHTFRPGSDPRSWLFTVCRHAFLRWRRREARYVDAPENDPELDSLGTAVDHWDAQRSGVAELVEQLDLGKAIGGALATLPDDFRIVVTLVDIEEMSYEEAAVVLGVPIGTVRSRLFRARRRLQAELFSEARDRGFAAAQPIGHVAESHLDITTS